MVQRMKDEAESAAAEHPTSSKSSATHRSEFDFIKIIRQQALRGDQSPGKQSPSSFIPNPSSLLSGIGDDAAVIREVAGRDGVVTTDLLIESVDFHRETTTARLLGHKALAVSLSDVAAMGARPRWALLSLGIPPDIWDSDFLDEFYVGFFGLADAYDVRLVGGDVSRTDDKIVIDSIILGDCPHGHAILRRGARPGDHLFVTGSLGGAAAGLRLLDRGARVQEKNTADPDSHSVGQLLLRHLSPEPRVGWGLVLGEEQLASALIDISDGLSSDINHLCEESQVGALLDASSIPINPLLAEICGRRALDPLLLALHGGEDFELLFTVNPQALAKLPSKVDGVTITRIGTIQPASEGVQLAEGTRVWDLEPGGWDHFRN